MTSLTRPPPPLLRPNAKVTSTSDKGTNTGTRSPPQLSPLGQHYAYGPNANQSKQSFPTTNPKNKSRQGQGPGETPMNTPAFKPVPIAPRLGGRPIGRGMGFVSHAATPGNTPSSLETMGKRIAGRLQGTSGTGENGEAKEGGGGGARIAPSYE